MNINYLSSVLSECISFSFLKNFPQKIFFIKFSKKIQSLPLKNKINTFVLALSWGVSKGSNLSANSQNKISKKKLLISQQESQKPWKAKMHEKQRILTYQDARRI